MFDVQKIREDFPILSTQVHGHPLVYLDNAATMQVPNQVLDRVTDHYRTSNANVHRGMHYLAHMSTDALEQARETIARFAGVPDARGVVFTRGTTDALNMAAQGLAHLVEPGDRVVVSVMEHHSNYVPWQQLCFEKGAEFCVVGLDERGDVDLEQLGFVLAGGADAPRGHVAPGVLLPAEPGPVKIVAMTGCSNVLGAALPVRKVADAAHAAGALFVLDAAQVARHAVLDMQQLRFDFLAMSGHKFGAGTGIGALCGSLVAMELLQPRDFGGEMVGEVSAGMTTFEELPLRLEAGTPNYVGAVAMAAACDYLESVGKEQIAAYEQQLVDRALEGLQRIEGLHVLGSPKQRAGLVSFAIGDVHPLDLCTMLDTRGVALRSGHNCAQPLLDWCKLDSVSRISPAFYNTIEEIDMAVELIDKTAAMLRRARG